MANQEKTGELDLWAIRGRLSRLVRRVGKSWTSELPFQWWELAGYGGLLIVAATTRLWDLGSRAMHHDESLHAFYAWNLANGKGYEHNPMMHGPFQFESSAAIFLVLGDSDYTARLLYALMGTLLVALPLLFRGRLGRIGALFVATGLTFSPALLYFSRFARNDIVSAVWTLGLVIAMWRYIDEEKNRYLYAASALLALMFTTKETSYIGTAVLGLYLVLVVAANKLARAGEGLSVEGLSPPAAAARAVSSVWSSVRRKPLLAGVERPASFLILLITLTMPQWSAFISLFQDWRILSWSNLVLAQPVGRPHIGAPEGGGIVIAFVVVVSLLGLSARWGSRWNWSIWWRCALIFYAVWALLYSTFFTNMIGIGSGIWQSLGYWAVQQDVARGDQPWHYYLIISSVYEFLPLILAVVAAVYYARRNDVFGRFLVYWAVATFVMYTLASEKMPWLLVNVTLPLIVLSGKFLADVVRGIEWRRLVAGGGLLLLPGVPLLLVLLWQLAFFDSDTGEAANLLFLLGLAAAALAMIAFGVYLARGTGSRNFAAFALVPVALILLALSVRTGWIASYRNGDVPVEMIVYTQTSPDIVGLVSQIEQLADATGRNDGVPVSVDQTSGFTWPWAWYFRDYARVDFPTYAGLPPEGAPDSAVVLVHLRNQDEVDEALREGFTEGVRFKHRWWFPEHKYKRLTLRKFLGAFLDRDAWRRSMDYFLYRKGVDREHLGSEDAVAYFRTPAPEPSGTP